jgi:hypothetical protein
MDLLAQATGTATEALRSRRDPSAVAERRRVAARRRLTAWSLICLVLATLGVVEGIEVFSGGASATSIGMLVLLAGLLAYGLIGAARAGIDLRARTLAVRRLPAPQPARRPVTAGIRPLMGRLDSYSDALRQLVGSLGSGGPGSPVRRLRDDTLQAADAAETRLRAQAAELTAVVRAGGAGTTLPATRERLERDIADGVEEYGRLVAAAGEAASAWGELHRSAAGGGSIAQVTEELTALAAGMRELVRPAAPPT